MNNQIKISITVPIYNAVKYLKKCLDSIAAQTLKEIEVILIDDGSDDGSAEICNQYLADPRFSYYYKENEGLASARQDGIERSHGEFIGFIDADDWIDPDMYEKMYITAKDFNADVVYCNRVVNENGYLPSLEVPEGFYDRGHILSDILPISLAYVGKKGEKRVISWNNCRRIYRKKLLDDFGFEFDRRFRRSQDSQLTFEAMTHAQGFYYMGNFRPYHTREVASSLSRGYTKNMWSLYIPLIERLYKDTAEFKELDLMPQMHLRAFFWVTDCIDNEFKPLCPNDENVKLGKIREIVEHPLCERYYGIIEIGQMSLLYRKYYELIHNKDAEGIISFTNWYMRKENRQKKRQASRARIANFITEGPVIGTVFKKIRHRK